MRLSDAIDTYITDMQSLGRINSERTVRSYRKALTNHAEDVSNRDPRYTNRDDVKVTLRRYKNPNSQRILRSILVSFYDWALEEGLRKDNPARQTRRPRRRPVTKYRLTQEETRRVLLAATGTRERRALYLGMCAGLRSQELRGLQGRHFSRPGWVWVSPDIGKGGRERWVPVLPDLEPIVAEIQEHVEADEYVLPAQRFRDPGWNKEKVDYTRQPCSPKGLWSLVRVVGERAGIASGISPHTLRHAFADHIAHFVDVRTAQHLLGHASLATTEGYLNQAPRLDDLALKVEGLSFGVHIERVFQEAEELLANPHAEPTYLEPVFKVNRAVKRDRGPIPPTPNDNPKD